MGPAPLGGSCEGREVSTHKGTPSLAGMEGGRGGGSFRAMKKSAATGVQKAKQRDSHTEDRCQPALTNLRGLSLTHRGGCGLGAEAQALEVRPQ